MHDIFVKGRIDRPKSLKEKTCSLLTTSLQIVSLLYRNAEGESCILATQITSTAIMFVKVKYILSVISITFWCH